MDIAFTLTETQLILHNIKFICPGKPFKLPSHISIFVLHWYLNKRSLRKSKNSKKIYGITRIKDILNNIEGPGGKWD